MLRQIPLSLLFILTLGFTTLGNANPFNQEPKIGSLNELLDLVKQGRVEQSKENNARERRFKSDQANQEKLLAQAIKERKALESSSEKLENNYDANKVVLDDLTLRLNSRMGSLKELFTHL